MKRSFSSILLRSLVLVSVVPGIALSEGRPFVLSDHQLDTVTAGYVRLEIDAQASARFDNPQTVALTMTTIKVDESARDDGYIYTVAQGHGYAYARGEKFFTELDILLDTDEEFVRYDIRQVNNRSGSDYQMLLPTRTTPYGSRVGEQLGFVTVHVVTRQRATDMQRP